MNNRRITNNKYIKDDISTNEVFMSMIGIGNNTMSLGIGMVNLGKENVKLQATNDASEIYTINKNILDIKEDMSFAFGMLLTDLTFFIKNSDVAQKLLTGTRIADTTVEIFTEYLENKTVNIPDITTVASDITNLLSNVRHVIAKVAFGAVSQIFAFLGNLASADEKLGSNIHIDDLWSVLISSEISPEELQQALEKTLSPFKKAVEDKYNDVSEWMDAYREDNIALIGDENGIVTNDYIEGNWKHNTIKGLDGNDTLDGKAGNDHLYGGTGNDTLIGGEGNDYLAGGTGYDTYHIKDRDTIYDVDGKGRILFDSQALPNAFIKREGASGIWEAKNSNGDILFTAFKSGRDLAIYSAKTTTDTVTIQDFFDVAKHVESTYSALSIVLGDSQEDIDNYGVYTIKADDSYMSSINTGGVFTSKHIEIIGSEKIDNIYGMGKKQLTVEAGKGNDYILGGDLKDTIHGGEGNDYIYGSPAYYDFEPKGSNRLPDNDNDLLIGGEGNDLISGGVGDDVIWVDEEYQGTSATAMDEDMANPNNAHHNNKGDWAVGGRGNDVIHGGVNRDFLQGGADSDTIYGGGGNDVILGDGYIRFGQKLQTIHNTDNINYDPSFIGGGHYLVPSLIGSGVSIQRGQPLSIEYIFEKGKLTETKYQIATFRDAISFNWDINVDINQGDYIFTPQKDISLSYDYHILAPEYAENAHDILYGGLGNDILIGQYGNDTLFGGEGNDVLFGDDNRDLTIIGNDTLNGGKGHDKLYAGKGDDILIASEGRDILDGGDDYDSYVLELSALQDGLDKTIIDKKGDGQLSIAGVDWATKIWQNIDLNDKNNSEPYLTQDSALRSRLQEAPTWTDGTGSFIQVVNGKLHIISRDFSSKIIIQSDEIQVSEGTNESHLPFNFKLELVKKNTAPEVVNQYDDQLVTAGQAFSLLLVNDLFNDADGDELNYQVSLANGQPLPTWLQFDANSKTLSGTAPSQSQVALKITATDPDGETAEQTFNLRANSAPEVANQYSDQLVTAGQAFSLLLANDLFNDADGDELNYQVSLANGQALPTWLQFDGNSKTLSGTAPSQSQVALKITAIDSYGETAEQTFHLRTNSAPELAEAFSPQFIVQPQRAKQQVWTYQTAKHFKDSDQDQLQYSVHIKSAPSGITSQAVSINSSTGVLSINQSFLQAGKYQLDITATDPHGQSYTATADINLVAPVSNPIAQTSPQADIFNHIGFQQPSLFNPIRQAKGGETHGYFFNDNIQGVANQAHQISGKAGNDKLYGANLNDVLSGDAGHDTLYGLQGNDTLSGGLGNDILVGGQGNDKLIGGEGNDTYIYQRGDGQDRIQDSKGLDVLDLSYGEISLNDLLISAENNVFGGQDIILQLSNEQSSTLHIENWANSVEYIKTVEGTFELKQLMDTII